MQEKIDMVVFDFDGTLVNSNNLKVDILLEVASRTFGGLSVMEQLHGNVEGDRHNLWSLWAREMGRDDAAEQASIYSFEVDKAVTFAPEMPGATKMLHALNEAGLELFVSSATPRKNLLSIIKARGWINHFRGIYGAPESKTNILNKYILPESNAAHRVAVVGDGVDDLASAARVGCQFFPVGEARGCPKDKNIKIYSLHELIDVFCNTN